MPEQGDYRPDDWKASFVRWRSLDELSGTEGSPPLLDSLILAVSVAIATAEVLFIVWLVGQL